MDPECPVAVATLWRPEPIEAQMPVAKLTKRFVDTVTADARRTLYYDSELTGFCLKVMPSGQMRWCVEYRPGGGRPGRRQEETGARLDQRPHPGASPHHVGRHSQEASGLQRACVVGRLIDRN